MSEGEYPLLPPGWVSLPGSTPSLLGSLFAAAAELYTLEPWLMLDGEALVEVRFPPDAAPRLVVVMGSGGDIHGLCAYDSYADLRRILEVGDPLEAAGEVSWLALTYDTRDYLSPDDLEAIERFGWRLASEESYPVVVRIGSPGPDLHSPALEDIIWLEAVLWGLVEWMGSAVRQPTARDFLQSAANLKVKTGGGLVDVAFHPVSGRV